MGGREVHVSRGLGRRGREGDQGLFGLIYL